MRPPPPTNENESFFFVEVGKMAVIKFASKQFGENDVISIDFALSEHSDKILTEFWQAC